MASTTPADSGVEDLEIARIMSVPAERWVERFGHGQLRFRAYASQMIGVGTCPMSPVPGDGWPNPCGGPQRVLVAGPGQDEGLAAFVPPSMDISTVPENAWVRVVGHFDDPAAQTCGAAPGSPETDTDTAVAMCRAIFVLDAIEVGG